MSLRGCLGPQPLRCGAEVSDYKGNTLSRQCQEKMIKYKAVERKSMCWCVQTGGGDGQRDNKKWELRSTARAGERKSKGWRVVLVVWGGEQRWSSCAKWLAVLKQKCVFQQEM